MLSYILTPYDTPHLTAYYLIWITFFVLVNSIWDWRSKRTRPFHFLHLKEKSNLLYDGSSFCSSLLVIMSLISVDVQKLSTSITIPLLIAGGSGLLRSIVALCPYKLEDIKEPAAASSPTTDAKPGEPPKLPPS